MAKSQGNKQHGNKQQKKTSLFFEHHCNIAYSSKITIFAVERVILTLFPRWLFC